MQTVSGLGGQHRLPKMLKMNTPAEAWETVCVTVNFVTLNVWGFILHPVPPVVSSPVDGSRLGDFIPFFSMSLPTVLSKADSFLPVVFVFSCFCFLMWKPSWEPGEEIGR